MTLVEYGAALLLEGWRGGKPPKTRAEVVEFLAAAAFHALDHDPDCGPKGMRQILSVGPMERDAWREARRRHRINLAQAIGTASWGPGGAALLERPYDGGQMAAEVTAVSLAEGPLDRAKIADRYGALRG